MFLRDGNGRTIFSTGQHAVEALITGATWVWGGRGGRVPVAPVSTGALVRQRETTRHPQLETGFFREIVKMCARTNSFKIPKACDSFNTFDIPHLPHNEHPGRPKRSTDRCYLQKYVHIQIAGNFTTKAHWVFHVPPGTTSNNSTFCRHTVFVCFVWISEQTAIVSLYSIN